MILSTKLRLTKCLVGMKMSSMSNFSCSVLQVDLFSEDIKNNLFLLSYQNSYNLVVMSSGICYVLETSMKRCL